MRVIISAAGTGGHINPGIAIANKIKEEEPNSEIIFIGTSRGLETDLVPRAGYELKTLEAYGLKKEFSITNLKNMWKTLNSTKVAKKYIKEFKPDIVIGTGGYICGPVFAAATSNKIPSILHESNAYPGKAVKMFAKKATKVLLGFEAAKSRLSGINNLVVTGTPTKVKKVQLNQQNKIEKLQEVLAEVPRVRKDSGFPPLVTPTSQIVGTQAVFNVIMGERYKTVTKEFKGLVKGEYGKTPVEIDPEFQKKILGNEEPITCRPADLLKPEFEEMKKECAEWLEQEEDVLSYAMFPKVAPKFFETRRNNKFIKFKIY